MSVLHQVVRIMPDYAIGIGNSDYLNSKLTYHPPILTCPLKSRYNG